LTNRNFNREEVPPLTFFIISQFPDIKPQTMLQILTPWTSNSYLYKVP
jgi:hypothetical protein